MRTSLTTAVVAFAATLAVVSNPQEVNAQCGKSIILKASENLGLTLGSLYDKVNANALGGKFWGENRIAEYVTTLYDSKEEIEVKIMNNRGDRRDLLDISAKVGIDMELASGTTVSGSASGKFVNHERRAAGTTELAMTVKRRTLTYMIGEELIQKLVPNSMHFGGEATHVVTRVDYGASVVANFEYLDSTVEDADDLNVAIDVTIESSSFIISGSVDVKIGSSESEALTAATVSLYSDIPLNTEGITYEDGIQAVTEFDDAFSKVNNGTGVPISFQLMPICFWESDKAGRFLRELNAKILDELMNLFDGFYDVQKRAKLLGKAAGKIGLPTLLYQTEDLGLAVSQFFGRMRVGFVQLLPKIRAGTLGETEIVDFMENIKNSPFAPYAVNRWLNGAAEMIALQRQIRNWVTKMSEGSVSTVRTFSDLQVFLRSPAVDTVVAFAHVGKPNGLNVHLETMQRFLKDENPEGYNGEFATTKFLQNVENTVRTRNAMELLRRFAAPKKYVCALAGCVWKRQVMVYLDYQSYKDELTSMGAPLDTSSLLLWQRGLLVNKEYKDCVSATDPRDHLTGKCLWSGQNDIPNGNRCSVDLNDETRGCAGDCGTDGFCTSLECPRQEGFGDWIFMGRRDWTQLAGWYFPKNIVDSDQLDYDPKNRGGGILSIRAQAFDTATTIFPTRSQMYSISQYEDTWTEDSTTFAEDFALDRPGRWRWVSPGLIMSAEFDNMCLQVVRRLNPDNTFDYSQVSLRPCNKYVDYQLWEISSEWGRPKFKIIRPNKPADEEVEYCLTVKWLPTAFVSNYTSLSFDDIAEYPESSVEMSECTEVITNGIDGQTFYEGFEIALGDQKIKFQYNYASNPKTQLVGQTEPSNTFAFWQNDQLMTYNYYHYEPFTLRVRDDLNDSAVVGFDLAAGDTPDLWEPRGAQIAKRGIAAYCLESVPGSASGDDLMVFKCDSTKPGQSVYDCQVEECKDTSCEEYGGGDVSFCVASSAPGSTGPQCYCKPGFGQVGADLMCVDVNACETAACDLEDYCIDFPPPAPDGASGRSCVPRTGCPKGQSAKDFPAEEDVVCEPCGPDQFQNKDSFFGEECSPYSGECEENETEENAPTAFNDRICKDCSVELCKQVDQPPPKTSDQENIGAASAKGFAGMGSVEITDNGDPALKNFVDDPMPWYILGGVGMFLIVVMIWYLKRRCCAGRRKEGKKAGTKKPKREKKAKGKAAASKNGELSPGQLGVRDDDPSGGLGAQRSRGSQDPGFGVSVNLNV